MNATKSKTEYKKVSERESQLTRIFDAKPSDVYKAMTDPEAIPKWWGPSYLTTVVEQMEVRVGGKWRFVQRMPNGQQFAFRGEYLEIIPNKKTVSTFEFESMPGHIVTETVTFEAFEGKTKVKAHSVFLTSEDLNGMFNSGMLEGASESHDRLEQLLQTY